jgi:hypothetical protein
MDSIIYKVIFKAIQYMENKNITLNFKNLAFKKPLIVPSKFLRELKILSEKSENIIFFQNIEEVIIVGNINSNVNYNYYLIILFSLKSGGEKHGYLIGNVKNVGDIIIGIWPFNRQISKLTPEIIIENYNDIINNPSEYSKICLISQ